MLGVPLRNRVTPFGAIIATSERGTMMGNRGILHNDRRELVRSTQLRRWICCVTSFKGIRRVIMKPHSYTELFFLDEATAFAAGHRPCFECRRTAAVAFQEAWTRACGDRATADQMDRVLEAERRTPRTGERRTFEAAARSLPDGAMVSWQGRPWLVFRGQLLLWTPGATWAERRSVDMRSTYLHPGRRRKCSAPATSWGPTSPPHARARQRAFRTAGSREFTGGSTRPVRARRPG